MLYLELSVEGKRGNHMSKAPRRKVSQRFSLSTSLILTSAVTALNPPSAPGVPPPASSGSSGEVHSVAASITGDEEFSMVSDTALLCS